MIELVFAIMAVLLVSYLAGLVWMLLVSILRSIHEWIMSWFFQRWF